MTKILRFFLFFTLLLGPAGLQGPQAKRVAPVASRQKKSVRRAKTSFWQKAGHSLWDFAVNDLWKVAVGFVAGYFCHKWLESASGTEEGESCPGTSTGSELETLLPMPAWVSSDPRGTFSPRQGANECSFYAVGNAIACCQPKGYVLGEAQSLISKILEKTRSRTDNALNVAKQRYQATKKLFDDAVATISKEKLQEVMSLQEKIPAALWQKNWSAQVAGSQQIKRPEVFVCEEGDSAEVKRLKKALQTRAQAEHVLTHKDAIRAAISKEELSGISSFEELQSLVMQQNKALGELVGSQLLKAAESSNAQELFDRALGHITFESEELEFLRTLQTLLSSRIGDDTPKPSLPAIFTENAEDGRQLVQLVKQGWQIVQTFKNGEVVASDVASEVVEHRASVEGAVYSALIAEVASAARSLAGAQTAYDYCHGGFASLGFAIKSIFLSYYTLYAELRGLPIIFLSTRQLQQVFEEACKLIVSHNAKEAVKQAFQKVIVDVPIENDSNCMQEEPLREIKQILDEYQATGKVAIVINRDESHFYCIDIDKKRSNCPMILRDSCAPDRWRPSNLELRVLSYLFDLDEMTLPSSAA